VMTLTDEQGKQDEEERKRKEEKYQWRRGTRERRYRVIAGRKRSARDDRDGTEMAGESMDRCASRFLFSQPILL
ncbi:hypothetical protein PRIPAC_72653, partial [Pristionchus pacificus]